MVLQNFRLLFFGSDAFSIRVLDRLLERNLCAIGVVTKPRSQLAAFSLKNKLPQRDWPLDDLNDLGSSYNVGLVASFGDLIDIRTIESFKHGMFNVHPSLLPQYRGSTPIQTAIRDGLDETGCTIMRIPPVAKFDVGEVVLQRKVRIHSKEYALDLRDRLADVGASMSEELLENFERCMLMMRPQEEHPRSYARKLKKEDGILHFKSEPAITIERKVRAYTGFIELTTVCFNGLKVKLDGLRDADEVCMYNIDGLLSNKFQDSNSAVCNQLAKPGTMSFHKPRRLLVIKCQDDRWLGFSSATPEYRPRMSAMDFFNGFLSKVKPDSRSTDI